MSSNQLFELKIIIQTKNHNWEWNKCELMMVQGHLLWSAFLLTLFVWFVSFNLRLKCRVVVEVVVVVALPLVPPLSMNASLDSSIALHFNTYILIKSADRAEDYNAQ